MCKKDFTKIADDILRGVDYDIYKDDYNELDNKLRDEIELRLINEFGAFDEMHALLNRLEKECEMFYSEFGEPSNGEYEAAFTEIKQLLAKARGEHV